MMSSPGQASSMTGYVIEYEEDFQEELSKVMPGAIWKTWEPVYADTLAHGKLVVDLAGRIQAVLKAHPEARLSSRKLKGLCHAEAVASKTWQRALKQAFQGNPQWI